VHAEMQLRDVLAAALHEEAVVVGLDPVFAHALILYRIITPPPTASRTRTMAAYVLAEIEITNPEGYKEYTAVVPATIAQHGGKFLVRGGAATPLEGEWPQVRRVLIEFASRDQ